MGNSKFRINQGGTGASTANDALNNFLPSQTGNSGKVLGTDGTNASWVSQGGGGGSLVIDETPSGTINGTNVTFTLANSPTSTVLLTLFDSTNGSGIPLLYGVDYTVSDATITMTTAPVTGTTLRAQYGTTTVSTSVTLTGDVVGSGTSNISTTISDGAITNAKMANMSDLTFKGNVSGSSAAPSDVTLNQLQAALSNNIVTESTTARTLAESDQCKYIRTTNASATTITVPANASVAFPVGTQIDIFQAGTGTVSFVAAGGVTINAPALSVSNQYKAASLKKVATDEWDLIIG